MRELILARQLLIMNGESGALDCELVLGMSCVVSLHSAFAHKIIARRDTFDIEIYYGRNQLVLLRYINGRATNELDYCAVTTHSRASFVSNVCACGSVTAMCAAVSSH